MIVTDGWSGWAKNLPRLRPAKLGATILKFPLTMVSRLKCVIEAGGAGGKNFLKQPD